MMPLATSIALTKLQSTFDYRDGSTRYWVNYTSFIVFVCLYVLVARSILCTCTVNIKYSTPNTECTFAISLY